MTRTKIDIDAIFNTQGLNTVHHDIQGISEMLIEGATQFDGKFSQTLQMYKQGIAEQTRELNTGLREYEADAKRIAADLGKSLGLSQQQIQQLSHGGQLTSQQVQQLTPQQSGQYGQLGDAQANVRDRRRILSEFRKVTQILQQGQAAGLDKNAMLQIMERVLGSNSPVYKQLAEQAKGERADQSAFAKDIGRVFRGIGLSQMIQQTATAQDIPAAVMGIGKTIMQGFTQSGSAIVSGIANLVNAGVVVAEKKREASTVLHQTLASTIGQFGGTAQGWLQASGAATGLERGTGPELMGFTYPQMYARRAELSRARGQAVGGGEAITALATERLGNVIDQGTIASALRLQRAPGAINLNAMIAQASQFRKGEGMDLSSLNENMQVLVELSRKQLSET